VSVGERIRERLDALGMRQAELARRVGISQPTISDLVRGDSRSSSHLHRIARELQTTPAYLTGETDNPEIGASLTSVPHLAAEQLDVGMMEEVDLAFGLGGAFHDHDSQPVATQVPFPRQWLRRFAGNNGEMISVAPGQGDSMEPTIKSGDLCLFDRAQQRIDRQDGIWALAIGDVLMIKRVRIAMDGSHLIISDNPNIPPERAVDGEMHVIGRVIAVIQQK